GWLRCRLVSHLAGSWAPSRSYFDARIERRRRQYRADPRFRIRAASGIWRREREPNAVRIIRNISGLRKRWLACPQLALQIRLENSALSDVLGWRHGTHDESNTTDLSFARLAARLARGSAGRTSPPHRLDVLGLPAWLPVGERRRGRGSARLGLRRNPGRAADRAAGRASCSGRLARPARTAGRAVRRHTA